MPAVTYDPVLAAQVARELLEDDERATPTPWTVLPIRSSFEVVRRSFVQRADGNANVAERLVADDAEVVARLRNNARRAGEQLEAAMEEIDDFRAATGAPEVHWECQQKIDALEEHVRVLIENIERLKHEVTNLDAHHRRVVTQRNHDWDALMVEIARTIGTAEDREAAELSQIDEFDPWNALRNYRKAALSTGDVEVLRAVRDHWGAPESVDTPELARERRAAHAALDKILAAHGTKSEAK